LPKKQHAQRKFLSFENWCNGELLSKIGHHFSNKVMFLRKMSIEKKKTEKDSGDFRRRKFSMNVKFRHFSTPPPHNQFSKFNNIL
jgi:hypothetical protein